MKKLISAALGLGSYEYTFTNSPSTLPLFLKAKSSAIQDSAGAPTSRLSINRSRAGNIFLGGSLGTDTILHSNSIPLHMRGHIGNPNIVGYLPLYLKGAGQSTGELPLFLKSAEGASGELPLYMFASLSNSAILNLYTKGHSDFASNSIPLSIPVVNQFSGPGVLGLPTNNIPLFLFSDFSPQNSMNLVTKGPNSAAVTGSMNLFISGRSYDVSGTLPLYLFNSGTTGSLPLFLYSPSTVNQFGYDNDGWFPDNGSMNLFLRVKEGGVIPLFLKAGNESNSGTLPLVLLGGITSTGSLDLSIPNVVAPINNSIFLFTHGF